MFIIIIISQCYIYIYDLVFSKNLNEEKFTYTSENVYFL